MSKQPWCSWISVCVVSQVCFHVGIPAGPKSTFSFIFLLGTSELRCKWPIQLYLYQKCASGGQNPFFLKPDDKSCGSATDVNFYMILWSGISSIIFTVASSVFEGDVFLEVFCPLFIASCRLEITVYIWIQSVNTILELNLVVIT